MWRSKPLYVGILVFYLCVIISGRGWADEISNDWSEIKNTIQTWVQENQSSINNSSNSSAQKSFKLIEEKLGRVHTDPQEEDHKKGNDEILIQIRRHFVDMHEGLQGNSSAQNSIKSLIGKITGTLNDWTVVCPTLNNLHKHIKEVVGKLENGNEKTTIQTSSDLIKSQFKQLKVFSGAKGDCESLIASSFKGSTDIIVNLDFYEERFNEEILGLIWRHLNIIYQNLHGPHPLREEIALNLRGLSSRLHRNHRVVINPDVETCSFRFGGPQAETNCDFYIDLRSAVEFIGDDDFSDSFGRVELRVRWLLYEFRHARKNIDFEDFQERDIWEYFWPMRFQLNLSGAMTARSRENSNPSPSTLPQISGAQALEGIAGLQIDLMDIYHRNHFGVFEPTFTAAFLGETGFFNRSEPGDNDLLRTHFFGTRIYYRGEEAVNGSYIDLGWRFNEAFEDQDSRALVRLYLPLRITKNNTKVFGAMEMDSGTGPDELKMILGVSVPLDSVAKSIETLFKGDAK